MIRRKLQERQDEMLEKSNLMMDVDEKIANIFEHSQMVSGLLSRLMYIIVRKGRSHLLLRKGIIKAEKKRAVERQMKIERALGSIPALKQRIEDMEEELRQKQISIDEFSQDSELLKSLYERGVIDANGEPT